MQDSVSDAGLAPRLCSRISVSAVRRPAQVVASVQTASRCRM
jgi:hypothetical protein